VHALSQHTPSTQNPVEHSLDFEQRWKPSIAGFAGTTGAPASATPMPLSTTPPSPGAAPHLAVARSQ
jgi:hypothetical protein